MKKISIYVCHHKDTPVYRSNCLIPIHAGKKIAKLDLGLIGDDTGDNISEKNGSFCELTVIYWMWKNVDSDYYGLFHYRRFLNFRKIGGGYDIFCKFDDQTIKQFGWSDEVISNLCEKYDIITSPIWSIHPVGLPNYKMTNYKFYEKEHFSKDLDIVVEIIKEKYPDMYPYVLKSLYSKECFFANMMIMNKKYFNEYCEWIFDVLFEAEKLIDISNYDSYQKRIWGFIAERLSNCFLEYVKSKNPSIKSTSLGMVFGVFDNNDFSKEIIIENIEKNKKLSKDIFVDEKVNIVFSVDNNYSKYCAVAIKSLLDNVNSEQKIDIYIIHDDDFIEKNKGLLSEYESFSVRIIFLKVDKSLFEFYPLNREHISIATYYRLSLHKVIPDYIDKVLYLDSDIIVLDNIVKLWQNDFEGNSLAGVPDEGGVMQIRRLGLPMTHNYINAGVCLMNLKKMREDNLDHLYSESLYQNFDLITLQDQDILNLTFKNKIKKLNLNWNVQSRFYKPNELEFSYSRSELESAALSPSIIHFSDREKPWLPSCRHPLKFYYKFYENKIDLAWKQQKSNYSLLDFLSYDIKGDKVDLYFNFKEWNTVVTINKKFARFVYKILKKIAKLFK